MHALCVWGSIYSISIHGGLTDKALASEARVWARVWVPSGLWGKQSAAAEACWSHNPEVDGSNPSSAKYGLLKSGQYSMGSTAKAQELKSQHCQAATVGLLSLKVLRKIFVLFHTPSFVYWAVISLCFALWIWRHAISSICPSTSPWLTMCSNFLTSWLVRRKEFHSVVKYMWWYYMCTLFQQLGIVKLLQLH